MEIESLGTEVTYRCIRCRGCPNCKKDGSIESISIQEEIGQRLINKSVIINLKQGYIIATLPFLCDPDKKLAANTHIAMKIYFSQIKKLNLNPKAKQDIVIAEGKMQKWVLLTS